MSSRQNQLSEVRKYIEEVDKEVTIILQSLQWDKKRLLQCKPKSTCQFNSTHKIPPEKLKEHEEKCVLRSQGYLEDDIMLPDVFDANSNTFIKLSFENINDIINYASTTDPAFIRGDGNVTSEAQSADRLRAAYSSDERRAIYDVVVNSRPSCDELSDLALGEGGASQQDKSDSRSKSRLQQLAELRDLRRRRARYRVAARTRNYSHALRGLIAAQMEMYTEAIDHAKSTSRDESQCKYRKAKEDRTDIRSDTNLDTNITEHRGINKERRSAGDNYRRNDYSENKRKFDYYDHKDSPKHEKKRHLTSTEQGGKHYDSNKRRQERSSDSYKEEDSKKYNKSSNDRSRRSYVIEERDRYSSGSRDSGRYRESDREERYYEDRSNERDRSGRSDHRQYSNDPYKKAKEHHRDKRKHRY